jgi:hypothetical protein
MWWKLLWLPKWKMQRSCRCSNMQQTLRFERSQVALSDFVDIPIGEHRSIPTKRRIQAMAHSYTLMKRGYKIVGFETTGGGHVVRYIGR